MSKKLPHKIDTDDLLKALESSDDTTEFLNFKNDVPLFLSKFKIEAGKNIVPVIVLYDLYKIYSSSPIEYGEFSQSISQFLPRNKMAYPLLNLSATKIQKILNKPVNKSHTSSASTQKHFTTFLEKEGITKGTTWVLCEMFYEIYRHYCIDNKLKTRMSKRTFTIVSKLHFETKDVGMLHDTYYKLNENIGNNLSKEVQERIIKERKDANQKYLDKHNAVRRRKRHEKTKEKQSKKQ